MDGRLKFMACCLSEIRVSGAAACRGEVLAMILRRASSISVLSSMAQRMPDLAAELATVVDFMAKGPRKNAP